MIEPYKNIYTFLKHIVSFFITILYRPKYINRSYVPQTGPVILAGNHKSYVDPLLVCCSNKRMVHFLAKKELHDSKFGFFFKVVGTIPVNRKIHDKDAKIEAIKELNNNRIIGIFPEGTRNLISCTILPFKYGAVSMAQKTNSTIIPFVITGNYKLFNNDLKLTYLKPFKVGNYTLEEANQKLEEIISNALIDSKK